MLKVPFEEIKQILEKRDAMRKYYEELERKLETYDEFERVEDFYRLPSNIYRDAVQSLSFDIESALKQLNIMLAECVDASYIPRENNEVSK